MNGEGGNGMPVLCAVKCVRCGEEGTIPEQ